ncbi:MAG: arylesterase [Cyclobacteriaceae bacterium]
MGARNFYIILIVLASFGCQQKADKTDKANVVQKSTPENKETTNDKKVIAFFGNSITAGYQLDMSEAFPALIGNIIDSLGLDYRVVNAGLSGETTASGLTRVDWVLKNKVDVFVLELGANDGLRGIQTDETIKNLQGIIDKVKNKYPEAKVVLAGMQIPPNLGQEYSGAFKEIFPKLADKNQTALIPFLLEGVAGEPDLNLNDGIHPTPEGHQILAKNVWHVLEPIL